MITLRGRARERLRSDLRAHREIYTLNDSAYAADVLKVSLNTFKKCLKVTRAEPLTLNRGTFVKIFAGAGLDPRNYGLAVSLPLQDSPYGGYDKTDYKRICGRYFLYRRSFLTGRNVTRSILEIYMNKTKECLSFHELHCYVSDSGVRDELHYYGDIYLNQERTMISMPAYFEGQVRLTLLHIPQKLRAHEKIKMRGALLAFGLPKGYWQPVLAAVYIEGSVASRQANPKDLCGTVRNDDKQYAALSAELAHVEEHSVIIPSMLWERAQLTPRLAVAR